MEILTSKLRIWGKIGLVTRLIFRRACDNITLELVPASRKGSPS